MPQLGELGLALGAREGGTLGDGLRGVFPPPRDGVQRQVRHDPVQPRPHLGPPLEGAEPSVRPDERILGEILGHHRVPHDPQRRPEDEVLVSADEFPERLEVVLDHRHQLVVGERRVALCVTAWTHDVLGRFPETYTWGAAGAARDGHGLIVTRVPTVRAGASGASSSVPPMRAAVLHERSPDERRVAAVAATVEKMTEWGWDVAVEPGAGAGAGVTDGAFTAAGATVTRDALAGAALVLQVGPPEPSLIGEFGEGSTVVGFLDPFVRADLIREIARRRLTALAVEAIPRITLAQSMDALSSQANLAGYAAVLAAAGASPRMFPMMVTAAGTIPPAKALILGVGVAGLQAIATARRLGAVVHAYDIRTETKEQVESLGARFVAAPTEEADEGGYAREVEEDTQARQHEALAPFVADADIIVTTAQIPGRGAPRLVTSEMLAEMRPGSVIIDMAAATGGNVEGSRPGEVVEIGGVAIHGPTNLASAVAADASRMYARNLIGLLERARGDGGGLAIDLDDEILDGCTVVHEGEVRHPLSTALLERTAP